MAMTTLAFWSQGPETDESGTITVGFMVSYAEIELAESREEAIDMGGHQRSVRPLRGTRRRLQGRVREGLAGRTDHRGGGTPGRD